MLKQKKIWQDEHERPSSIPSLAQVDPSSPVVAFTSFLKEKNALQGKAIDIGCGKGRNSLFLAQQGLHVVAMDYIGHALQVVRERAAQWGIGSRIETVESAMDERWPFEDGIFDVAVDNFSSIDVETESGRKMYRSELFRCLKPGGFALVAVVSANDELEHAMMSLSPGLEKNSVIWPENQKFQKNYDVQEVQEFYSEFIIHSIQEISKPAEKLGRKYTATNIILYLQKPTRSATPNSQ